MAGSSPGTTPQAQQKRGGQGPSSGKHTGRQQRAPRPPTKEAQHASKGPRAWKEKGPANVVTSTNALSVGGSSSILQGVDYVSLPITPTNFRLFPNIRGMVSNYGQYVVDDLKVEATPVASSLSAGAYVVAVVP